MRNQLTVGKNCIMSQFNGFIDIDVVHDNQWTFSYKGEKQKPENISVYKMFRFGLYWMEPTSELKWDFFQIGFGCIFGNHSANLGWASECNFTNIGMNDKCVSSCWPKTGNNLGKEQPFRYAELFYFLFFLLRILFARFAYHWSHHPGSRLVLTILLYIEQSVVFVRPVSKRLCNQRPMLGPISMIPGVNI